MQTVQILSLVRVLILQAIMPCTKERGLAMRDYYTMKGTREGEFLLLCFISF